MNIVNNTSMHTGIGCDPINRKCLMVYLTFLMYLSYSNRHRVKKLAYFMVRSTSVNVLNPY